MLMAFIAILLAGACLYALMSFTVSERTHECGIRAALGAPPLNIVAQIARRAFVQLSTGVAIGAFLSAIMLSRSADIGAGAMARTSSWPLTVAAIALLVIVAGMSACVRPTLRVLRIRPLDALRG